MFRAIGCASCHTPRLVTGHSSNPLFERKGVELYSDLLPHDVGTGDSIEQAAAEANEIRTPALCGLRLGSSFLHDSSAATQDEAIRCEGGESATLTQTLTQRYHDASAQERAALLMFLGSL